MNNQILKSAHIKNFRSYKDSYIEFHPRVNVIIGANDSGKSNVLRAINWPISNRPMGDDLFPTYWEGNPQVELDIENKIVGRFKSKTENLYTLTHSNGKEDIFKSFGKGVPEIIKDHLNISPVNINFQLDGPFLLGQSPADVARHYNGLVNLEIIDKTIYNIASVLRKERGELKTEQSSVEIKTEELKKFDWINNAERKLSELEKLNSYLKHLNSEWSDLAGLIQNLEQLEKQNQELYKITKHEKLTNDLIHKGREIRIISVDQINLTLLVSELNDLIEESKKLNEIIQCQDNVNSLIKKANQIDEDIEKENKLKKCIEQLKQYQKAESQYKNTIKYSDETVRMLILDEKIEKAISTYNLLQDLLEKRLKLSQRQEILKDEAKKLDIEFRKLMPDECPLCGRGCNCER